MLKQARGLLSAAFCAAFFAAAAVFAQESTDFDALTTVPANASKAELIDFQAKLTEAGQSVAPVDASRFFPKSAEAFYASTKALLACELDAAERAKYTEQLAQILATQALNDAAILIADAEKTDSAPSLGAKYDELTALAATAAGRFEKEPTDENRRVFVSTVNATFGVRLRFAQHLPSAVRDEAFAALVSDAISFALAYPENGERTFELVMSVRAASPDLGAEAIDVLCETFEASGKPELAKPIQKMLGRRRFARLPGGELKFEGLLLKDGEFTEKFDWKNYEGKIVLIEFWATWCGPCRKEFPKLKEVYAKYKDRGFELIGYSIDQDVDALKKFVVDNELPWQIVSQTESVRAGYVGLYDYYAINGVPELILIGRDGKVIQTDARGDKLTAALEELIAAEDAQKEAENAK